MKLAQNLGPEKYVLFPADHVPMSVRIAYALVLTMYVRLCAYVLYGQPLIQSSKYQYLQILVFVRLHEVHRKLIDVSRTSLSSALQ